MVCVPQIEPIVGSIGAEWSGLIVTGARQRILVLKVAMTARSDRVIPDNLQTLRATADGNRLAPLPTTSPGTGVAV